MKVAVGAALVAFLASPCVAETTTGEITTAHQQYVEALNEGDAVMLASMSTEHAILLPPNAEMIEGREAIKEYWRSVFAAGLKDLSVRTVRVDEYGGDAASEIDRISLNAPATRDVLEGKYVIVWRKRDESWLLAAGIAEGDRGCDAAVGRGPCAGEFAYHEAVEVDDDGARGRVRSRAPQRRRLSVVVVVGPDRRRSQRRRQESTLHRVLRYGPRPWSLGVSPVCQSSCAQRGYTRQQQLAHSFLFLVPAEPADILDHVSVARI